MWSKRPSSLSQQWSYIAGGLKLQVCTTVHFTVHFSNSKIQELFQNCPLQWPIIPNLRTCANHLAHEWHVNNFSLDHGFGPNLVKCLKGPSIMIKLHVSYLSWPGPLVKCLKGLPIMISYVSPHHAHCIIWSSSKINLTDLDNLNNIAASHIILINDRDPLVPLAD